MRSSGLGARPESWTSAVSSAYAVSTADPLENPLPVAAVVLPSASSASVVSRTDSSSSAISAIPPALSATGPYASVAIVMPSVLSMPTAASAMPYVPNRLYAATMERATSRSGRTVESIPTPSPLMTTAPAPNSPACPMPLVGWKEPAVKYSVRPPIRLPSTRPIRMHAALPTGGAEGGGGREERGA
jgi:hypothetical protein